MPRRNVTRKKEKIEDADDLASLLRLWRDGELKYLAVEEQALAFEEIIDLCKNGYSEQLYSPKGEMGTVTRRDMKSAIAALVEYRKLIDSVREALASDDKVNITINVSKAIPSTPGTV